MTDLVGKFRQRIAEGKEVTPMEIIMIQSYIDGVFRLIIFVYSLALGVLAFTHEYIFIFTVLFFIIVFCIIYGFFTLVTVGNILLEVDGYNKFNMAFYYIETILLTLLFIGILYYMIQPFKNKDRKKLFSFDKSKI